MTRRIIKQVLKEENMNQSSAAKRLGIGRSTLRRHLQ
ncbi:MAG: helix-turn-helix domain-containing protein [Clostridium sp.]